MKILITGGAGFIGSQLCQAYLQCGHAVVVIDDLSHGDASRIPPEIPFYHLDISDRAGLEAVLLHEQPDVISHQAALVSVRDSVRFPDRFYQVNTEGTRNICELAQNAGVRKLMFASSGGAVYGEAACLPVDEEAECHAISPYGESKKLAEEILRANSDTIDTVILRYGNVYGPGQDPANNNSVISIFTHQMIRGERPVIFGDGSHIRDYVYIDDVVRANLLALETSVTGTYNIGTGVGSSLVEIYTQIAQLLHIDGSPLILPAYPFEVRRNILDVRRAKEVLNWQAEIPLKTGIEMTVKAALELINQSAPAQPVGGSGGNR